MSDACAYVIAHEQDEAVALLVAAGIAVAEIRLTGPDGQQRRVVRQRSRPDGRVDLVVARWQGAETE